LDKVCKLLTDRFKWYEKRPYRNPETVGIYRLTMKIGWFR